VRLQVNPPGSWDILRIIVAPLDSAGQPAAPLASAGFYVRAGTRIHAWDAQGTGRRGSAEDIVVGALVEVSHTGAADRTIPLHYTALRVDVARATP
jgi:hypothetical protein